MSDKTIRVGDLVMVVKPKSCCGSGALGMTFRVAFAGITGRPHGCVSCKAIFHNLPVALYEGVGYCALDRLLKIEPPAIPKSIDTPQEVSA